MGHGTPLLPAQSKLKRGYSIKGWERGEGGAETGGRRAGGGAETEGEEETQDCKRGGREKKW